jgi:hypothetical protein
LKIKNKIIANVSCIPDLYAEHPEGAMLVSPDSVDDLVQRLTTTRRRMIQVDIDGNCIRDRYFNGFDLTSAH